MVQYSLRPSCKSCSIRRHWKCHCKHFVRLSAREVFWGLHGARKIAETGRRLKEEMGSSPRRIPAHRRAGCPSAEMKDELRKRKAADAAMSIASPQAGSELASSWIGPKRSAVNSIFVADRWSDSNVKKSI